MRIVIDLPPSVARRAAQAVERGTYNSIDSLVAEALSNLLSREEATDPEQRARPVASFAAVDGEPNGEYVHSRDPAARWLWGMVNRVYPLKVAARVSAELARSGPVLMQTLHSAFVARGEKLGEILRRSDRDRGRRRNEALSVGFPAISEDEQKARVRFAHQFVGRRSGSGTYVGGAFETGLIGVTEGGTDWIAPTPLGWRFAAFHNELLDEGLVTGQNLTDAERRFYLCELTPLVPAERNAFHAILDVLSAAPIDASTLATRLEAYQDRSLPESVRDTSRSGALARLADVGGVARVAVGRSATYEITELGREALERLTSGRLN